MRCFQRQPDKEGSTDATVEICKKYGAKVANRRWTTYAEQFNWGLDNLPIQTPWVMRLDADEELTEGLVAELSTLLSSASEGIDGVYIRRRVYFLGRWIKHGGYYPTWLLRVFRNGGGRCESLWMDEHIVVKGGKTVRMYQDLIDRNNKDLTFWVDKHNHYANREVKDILAKRVGGALADDQLIQELHGQVKARRWAKNNLYGRAPLFFRSFIYFIYRYFFRLGFLDGAEGLIFHFLQGFWYRFLVDAKLFEHDHMSRKRR